MSAEAERWREVDVKRALAAEVQEAGDALAAALEACDQRNRGAAGGAAVNEAERWRAATDNAPAEDWWGAPIIAAGDALLAALEAAEVEKAHLTKVATEYQSRIAELEAGLRWIAEAEEGEPASDGLELAIARRIARDFLSGRAAGGEG